VAKIMELLAGNKSLEFIIQNEIGWCGIRFKKDSETIDLGADSIKIITKKLQTVLDTENFPESTSEINGKKISWFMTLSETYCSCYASKNLDITEILFYRNENFIATIQLNKNDCIKWRNHLNKFLADWQQEFERQKNSF
jgi:hypothetical protein